MTEQHMPARIWVRVCGGGVSLPSGRIYTAVVGQDVAQDRHAPFIRADRAERMVNALERCAEARMPGEARRIAREALSEFKAAIHV